ncbi:MAG TPA: imidazolonepropionase [Planctomycetota bacterium]|jgi:imidazolonepropionase|nr:imidazolonepropionase [Planctomycetota bacterium]
MALPAAPSGLLVRNAAQIATGSGPVLRGAALQNLRIHTDASLYAKNGSIVAVGAPRDVERQVEGSPTVIDARGSAVVPGFVDSHTHALFAGSRVDEFVDKIGGRSYQEIADRGGGIQSTVRAVRAADKAELKDLTRARLQSALEQGTTTMEIKSGYGLDPETELKMLEAIGELRSEQPIELLPTFLGAHAVPPGVSRETYVDQLLEMLPRAAATSAFCDVFCDPSYFPVPETRRILEAARNLGMKLHLHAGQFGKDGGIGLGLDLGVRSMSHLDAISDPEIARLGSSPTAGVLLPGVALFGRTPFPPARKLIQAGAIVALATNFNPGSCPSLSMPLMMALACMQMALSPAEALNAATVNGAYALGLEGVGTIEPGSRADLAILDLPDYRMLPYYFGVNHVRMVVKGGRLEWQR